MTHNKIPADHSPELPSKYQVQPEPKDTSEVTSRRGFLKTGVASLLGVTALMTQSDYARANIDWIEHFQRKYRLMSSQEKAEALARLEEHYSKNPVATAKDSTPEEKLAQLLREAESGNATAQYMLGMAYKTGQVFSLEMTEFDQPLAQHAAKFGIPDKESLGLVDSSKSLEWYQKAAAQGYGDALFMLGMISANCDDVPRDATRAVEWFLQAAEQGHSDAQFKLGVMYASGDGAPEDAAKAVEWWQKASAQGHASARANLGNA
ncbi:MAG: sel1 repeat family protein [Nitrosomonadales bacterium]|nr:sel1 repeat family protein [Nitrosomonadales bacterium]